jgi:ActR/RegA family two-component response regulator
LQEQRFMQVIIAARSAIARRNWANRLRQAAQAELQTGEASTLHAISVLVRRGSPALVVAEDDLAGGDAPVLVGTVRDSGHDGRIVLVSRNRDLARAPAGGWNGAVEIVDRTDIEDRLAALGGQIAGAAAGGDAVLAGILPFRVAERQIIETAIDRCDGNIGRAAQALQISPSTIYRKMQAWQGEPRA